MSVSTFPDIPSDRYIAVKDATRRRCARLAKRKKVTLCAEAIDRCVDRAAKILREGGTGNRAIDEGLALAKRLAGLRDRAPTTGGVS